MRFIYSLIGCVGDDIYVAGTVEERKLFVNKALTYLASGQIPQNSNSYNALNTKKLEMITFRNQSIIGLLVLVIFGLLVF